jgi:ubiquinone/menaquinone biosynthesis C-methylase UbiE
MSVGTIFPFAIIQADTMIRWLMLLKGELHKAPITNPQKILDLGTGTGIWALDIAEYDKHHHQFNIQVIKC